MLWFGLSCSFKELFIKKTDEKLLIYIANMSFMSSFQKRLAARILKVGNTKVWLDPSQKKDIDAAITSADIKKLIQKGYIKKLPTKIKFVKTKQKRKRKGIRKR